MVREWLGEPPPPTGAPVKERLRDSRDGKDYQAEFGKRKRGSGVYAELNDQRYKLAHPLLRIDGSSD